MTTLLTSHRGSVKKAEWYDQNFRWRQGGREIKGHGAGARRTSAGPLRRSDSEASAAGKTRPYNPACGRSLVTYFAFQAMRDASWALVFLLPVAVTQAEAIIHCRAYDDRIKIGVPAYQVQVIPHGIGLPDGVMRSYGTTG